MVEDVIFEDVLVPQVLIATIFNEIHDKEGHIGKGNLMK